MKFIIGKFRTFDLFKSMPSMRIKYLEVMKMNKNLQLKKRKYLGVLGRIAISLFLASALVGCAHVISKETLKEVDQGISFEELSKDPGKYLGKTVLLGGVIVKTENKKDGTLLEIYQTELDSYEAPINTDVSQGRFLAMDKRFLDSEIYRAGRKVTVAGVVNGVESIKLGEIDYPYPYLMIKEIHLWKEELRLRYGPRDWDFWDPYWVDPWYRWYWPYAWHHQNMYNKQDTTKKSQQGQGYTIDKSPVEGSSNK
jgi:outer membrane lipoprotein